MNALWKVSVIIGIFLALAGIVFSLQGLGIVGPSSSVMYNSQTWEYTGASIAIVGLIIFLAGVYALSREVKKSKTAEQKGSVKTDKS